MYYSDQQFVSAGAADADGLSLTHQQALSKFGEFIRTFQTEGKSTEFPYA